MFTSNSVSLASLVVNASAWVVHVRPLQMGLLERVTSDFLHDSRTTFLLCVRRLILLCFDVTTRPVITSALAGSLIYDCCKNGRRYNRAVLPLTLACTPDR